MNVKKDQREICTIKSDLLMREVVSGDEAEQGWYESTVVVDMIEARASGDPQGFVRHKIGLTLAVMLQEYQLPKEVFYVEFTVWAQTNLNYPKFAVRFG